MGVRKKLSIILAVFSLIVSACGGGDTSVAPDVEETSTTTSTTSTTLPGEVGEVVDEASLVVQPNLIKPIICATGILNSTGDDCEVISAKLQIENAEKYNKIFCSIV